MSLASYLHGLRLALAEGIVAVHESGGSPQDLARLHQLSAIIEDTAARCRAFLESGRCPPAQPILPAPPGLDPAVTTRRALEAFLDLEELLILALAPVGREV
jgi:hypothetical protein